MANDSSSDKHVFFWKPDRKNGEFSQWYPTGFTVNGTWYTTAEHFMMHCKSLVFKDSKTADKIMHGGGRASPAQHRKLGRSVVGFDVSRWESVSMQVVVLGNLCKFTQKAELGAVLLATGDKMLVEASPYDHIWGVGYTEKHALSNVDTWGQNKLGRALMTVREVVKARHAMGYTTPFTDIKELQDVAYECLTIPDFNPTSLIELMASLNEHEHEPDHPHQPDQQQ